MLPEISVFTTTRIHWRQSYNVSHQELCLVRSLDCNKKKTLQHLACSQPFLTKKTLLGKNKITGDPVVYIVALTKLKLTKLKIRLRRLGTSP